MSAPRSHRFPLRVLPDRCFPALSLLPGQRPAPLARCPAVGNTPMSTPISAMRTSAVRLFTPGIVSRRLTSAARGHHLIQVRTRRLNHLVEEVAVGEHLTDQKGIMGPTAPGQAL